MEWPSDFQCSPLMDESLFGLLSSTHHELETEPKQSEWTVEEKKLLESALSEIDSSSPAFLENVASRIPWKSMEDIKNHYQSLLDDIHVIDSGKSPIPDYPDHHHHMEDQPKKEGDANKTRSQRRRGIPWTEEEHQLFLMGLNKYGKGDWRSISRYYVISKTPTQVASHAQKYFRRQTSTTPADRRRPSIHDIQTVTPTPIAPVRPTTLVEPNFIPNPMLDMMYNNNPDMIMMNMMINNNPNFDGMIFNHNINVPAGDATGAYAASSSSSPFMLPTMMNQPYWG